MNQDSTLLERVAMLEATTAQINQRLQEINENIRGMRTDFRWMFGLLFTATLVLAIAAFVS